MLTAMVNTAEVYPLLWSADVAAIVDWAELSLGLTTSWRSANDSGVVEHAELTWPGGRVSVNINRDQFPVTGPAGIALRLDDRAAIDACHAKAVAAGAEIMQGPEDSPVAYGFTALDPDGNQWWVNAETGFLDSLRKTTSSS